MPRAMGVFHNTVTQPASKSIQRRRGPTPFLWDQSAKSLPTVLWLILILPRGTDGDLDGKGLSNRKEDPRESGGFPRVSTDEI